MFYTNTNTMLLNDDTMRSRIKKFFYDELFINCQLILFLAKYDNFYNYIDFIYTIIDFIYIQGPIESHVKADTT